MTVDLHSHILFDIDDGASNIDVSIELMKRQERQGVKTVVLTPHFNPSKQVLSEFISKRNKNVTVLREEMKKQGLEIQVLTGSEIYYTTDILEMNLDDLVIEGTDYVLIEFSTRVTPSNLTKQMSIILSKGYIPIFAHVERYAFFREMSAEMVDLINQGILMQVNGETFINGKEKNFLKACIKRNLIHLIASDTHSLDRRPPNLECSYDNIRRDFGDEFANYLIENSFKIIENDGVDIYEPSPLQKFLGRYI